MFILSKILLVLSLIRQKKKLLYEDESVNVSLLEITFSLFQS